MRKPDCKTCEKYKKRLAIVLEDAVNERVSTTLEAHNIARSQCCRGCEGENGIGLFDGK